MQIGAKDIKNLFMTITLDGNYFFEKTPFSSSLFENYLNIFQFEIVQRTTYGT